MSTQTPKRTMVQVDVTIDKFNSLTRFTGRVGTVLTFINAGANVPVNLANVLLRKTAEHAAEMSGFRSARVAGVTITKTNSIKVYHFSVEVDA